MWWLGLGLAVLWPACAVPEAGGGSSPLPAARGFTQVLTPGALGQGHWGMRWPTVLGCLGRLALSGVGWGLCRGVWGRSGSWGLGLAHGPCLGGWGLAGSVGCCPGSRGASPYAYGGSVRRLPLQFSGWMRGCPCGGLPGFCTPWGLLVAWPSLLASDCWGGLWIVALYTYTLITKHGYHVGVPCVSQVHAHTHTRARTHTFISPVACSLSSWCVILWFEVIYIHSCVVLDCCYLCFFSLLVCFQVLLVALRLDSP